MSNKRKSDDPLLSFWGCVAFLNLPKDWASEANKRGLIPTLSGYCFPSEMRQAFREHHAILNEIRPSRRRREGVPVSGSVVSRSGGLRRQSTPSSAERLEMSESHDSR